MKKIITLFLLIIFIGSLNVSCANIESEVNSNVSVDSSFSDLSSPNMSSLVSEIKEEEVTSSVKSITPEKQNHIYTQKEIQEMSFRDSLLGFTLYGRIYDYLGWTTTKSGEDMLFIQSSERMNVSEKDGAYFDPIYETDLICLKANPKGEEWTFDSTTETMWTYPLKQTRIESICFDEKYVYIGTTDRLDKTNLNESDVCVLCLHKETGKQRWKRIVDGPVTTNLYLHDAKLYFGVETPEKGIIYTLSCRNGSSIHKVSSNCKSFYSMVFTEDGLYYTSHPNADYFQATVFYYSFDTQKEIFFWNPASYAGSQIPGKSNLVLDHSILYYYIETTEIDENQKLYLAAVVFALDTSSHSPSYSEENKLLWSKKVLLPFVYYLHELILNDNTLYISVGQQEQGACCVALDLTSQEVIWETRVQGYIIEQAYAIFDHLYYIVSPTENIINGRFGFTGHSQQVLELDKETGEIWGKSPESPYSGVYRIDGTYRNNLITQGPNASYLQIYPME